MPRIRRKGMDWKLIPTFHPCSVLPTSGEGYPLFVKQKKCKEIPPSSASSPSWIKIVHSECKPKWIPLIDSVWKLEGGLQPAEEGSSGTAFSRRSGWQAAAWLVLWWSLISLQVGLCGAVAWDSRGLDSTTFEISFHHMFFNCNEITGYNRHSSVFFMEATLVYTSWESALVWPKSRLATFNPCNVW